MLKTVTYLTKPISIFIVHLDGLRTCKNGLRSVVIMMDIYVRMCWLHYCVMFIVTIKIMLNLMKFFLFLLMFLQMKFSVWTARSISFNKVKFFRFFFLQFKVKTFLYKITHRLGIGERYYHSQKGLFSVFFFLLSFEKVERC